MKFNLSELTPWADLHRMLQNMRTLTVVANGVEYAAEADIEADEEGNVRLVVWGQVDAGDKAEPDTDWRDLRFEPAPADEPGLTEKMPGEA